MNIIITLPINLIAEIAEGRKQVEIRKSFPKNFNPDEDVVWVKTKGKDKVALCFTVSHFSEWYDIEDVWRCYNKKIGMPYAWLCTYAKRGERICVWHIQRVTLFYPNLSFSKTFKGKSAPQQYCYTEVQLSNYSSSF